MGGVHANTWVVCTQGMCQVLSASLFPLPEGWFCETVWQAVGRVWWRGAPGNWQAGADQAAARASPR